MPALGRRFALSVGFFTSSVLGTLRQIKSILIAVYCLQSQLQLQLIGGNVKVVSDAPGASVQLKESAHNQCK